jgi:hypothetical protein
MRAALVAALATIAIALTSCAKCPPPEQQRANEALQRRFAAGYATAFRQMQQARDTAQNSMLAALTSAHRTELANLVGQLVTTTHPDFTRAARQLNASLTPGEKGAILKASAELRAQYDRTISALDKTNSVNGVGISPSEFGVSQDAGMTLLLMVIHQTSVRASQAARETLPPDLDPR